MQRDTEALAGSGWLAPGNLEAPADNFRSEPGRGWRPSPDGPARHGGALLCRGGRTLRRGAARAPGGLLSCPCLPGWLECFPWPMAIGVLPRRRQPGARPPGCLKPTGAVRGTERGAGARGGVPTWTGTLEETPGL
ncbi:hypothetical protein NDU88_006670 [Pleurodeles waltl]|uniref:Uncharacterized protein n=1 Tax=Pleurodeles waltl TaxID=8319 RepID=A0AAV7U0T1_PLEWA|nr:hypothetical protein NDU88_006670 [Pleurodeles waltl]